MKKFALIAIIAIASFALLGPVVHAQGTSKGPLINPNGLALDTATQAAVEGPVTPAINGTAKTFNIVLVTLKISGTIAGTVTWEGSNDGVNYVSITTPATLVNASTNYTYKEVDKGYLYYKALITQTGTSSLSYAGTYYVTRPTISNGR